MNAADQRRLTPWLAGLCLGLGAVWAVFLSGWGSGVSWLPPGAARAVPVAKHPVHAGTEPPLENDAEVWQRPLFTVDRKPAPVASGKGASANLDNLELTGVIMAQGMHIALLTDRDDGHTVRVHEGEHLAHGDWVLKTLSPRSAEFVDNGQVTRLALKVPAGGNPSAPDSAPPPPRPPPKRHRVAQPPRQANDQATKQRIQALKKRIEQRRRQQAAHAGDH